ncbi:hypothetical protein IRJ41_002402 [Triplophysa rosa]|uniref:Uncharacterized protein n=1 Tax=Triplophysa rosa TaxID=992332 RepID=A0A9W7X492_TRIRA|nr:hypothetical protein IRJ41_002402 [Triplophysa rosa]
MLGSTSCSAVQGDPHSHVECLHDSPGKSSKVCWILYLVVIWCLDSAVSIGVDFMETDFSCLYLGKHQREN